MKTFAFIVIALAFVTSPAKAEWSQIRIACIKSVGYAPADWDARRVPAGPAQRYRACRAKAEGKTR